MECFPSGCFSLLGFHTSLPQISSGYLGRNTTQPHTFLYWDSYTKEHTTGVFTLLGFHTSVPQISAGYLGINSAQPHLLKLRLFLKKKNTHSFSIKAIQRLDSADPHYTVLIPVPKLLIPCTFYLPSLQLLLPPGTSNSSQFPTQIAIHHNYSL